MLGVKSGVAWRLDSGLTQTSVTGLLPSESRASGSTDILAVGLWWLPKIAEVKFEQMR